MTLTPGERKILAAIEDEISEKDPHLATMLTNMPVGSGAGTWSPVPARHVVLLIAALTVLAGLSPIISELGVAAIAVCTVALIVPWLLSAARAARTRGSVREKREESPPDSSADGGAGRSRPSRQP